MGIKTLSLDPRITARKPGTPLVVFLAPVPFYPHPNLRRYRFLTSGIPDIEEGLSKQNAGFGLRTYPDHSLAAQIGKPERAHV